MLRSILKEIDYTQPPTPILYDNLTAVGIANNTVKMLKIYGNKIILGVRSIQNEQL